MELESGKRNDLQPRDSVPGRRWICMYVVGVPIDNHIGPELRA
jgi:hypothetical protein